MAISANSYGTVAGVVARARRYADKAGEFTLATAPTLAQVEGWIDQVSALVNSILAQNRFSIPVTQSDVALILAGFVEDEVSAMVEGANGSGRFGPGNQNERRSRYEIVTSEVGKFVSDNAAGFEAMGVPRNSLVTKAGSRPVIRADGFSNDLTATYASQLE
jgi:hypothetical protein